MPSSAIPGQDEPHVEGSERSIGFCFKSSGVRWERNCLKGWKRKEAFYLLFEVIPNVIDGIFALFFGENITNYDESVLVKKLIVISDMIV